MKTVRKEGEGASAAAPPVPRVEEARMKRNKEESLKLIQKQLVLLLHSHACLKKDVAQEGGSVSQCTVPNCRMMREVWLHIKKCRTGPACPHLHCLSSLKILAHWKHCKDLECSVCRLIRIKGAQQLQLQYATASAQSTATATATEQGQDCPGAASIHNQRYGYNHPQQQYIVRHLYQCIPHFTPLPMFGMPYNLPLGEGRRGDSGGGETNRTGQSVPVPSATDVRTAYEQLGIPCPVDALKRLMATLPGGTTEDEGGVEMGATESHVESDDGINEEESESTSTIIHRLIVNGERQKIVKLDGGV